MTTKKPGSGQPRDVLRLPRMAQDSTGYLDLLDLFLMVEDTNTRPFSVVSIRVKKKCVHSAQPHCSGMNVTIQKHQGEQNFKL